MLFKSKINFEQKIFLVNNLSLLLKSGVSLLTTFYFLTKQKYLASISKELEGVAISIKRGNTLADSFAKFPKVFDKMFVNIIRIAESSGKLDEGLEILKKYYEKNLKLKSEIINALTYPLLVLALVLAICLFVIFYIFPKLLTVFRQFPIELPIQTKILLAFGRFLSSPRLVLVFFIGAFILMSIFYSLYAEVSGFKLLTHRFIFKIPIIGNFLKNTLLSIFYNNLAITLKSGLSLNIGLKVIEENNDNLYFKNILEEVNHKVIGGKYLSESLQEEQEEDTFFFDNLAIEVIKIGEETGNLQNSFVYLGEFYENEIKNFIFKISNLLEPILLIFVGGIVLFLAFSVLLPILHFIQTINVG